jgi:hypothetical protein
MERNANGTYTITSQNAAGRRSTLLSDDTRSGITSAWNWVDIVLETYSIDDCAEYSAGATMAFRDMSLVDVNGTSLEKPQFQMKPYINGVYLPGKEAAEFTACCDGAFDVAFPTATMRNN